MRMLFRCKSALFAVLTILLFISAAPSAGQSVSARQDQQIIPTYVVEQADRNPMFYKQEVYQGAKKVIYPYALLDNLTDRRVDKSYDTVVLENEYVKIEFLPELGARLFSALDKTNNYDYFYHQHVIKPALIGMLGAWISGGIEWCVMHHHRATTFMPVDYTIIENDDGSRTFWFGETERRHRMKWSMGATLYPGKSYLEVKTKIFNRTAQPESFLYWANVAVHATDDYQIIFPPSTRCATYHAKNDFTHWPIGRETYRGVDYTGVDLSWWKNHPEPVSFFAWDLAEDFSGGYDHGRSAGVVHFANHHIFVGSKLWEWGPGPRGRMWDKFLTDTDGPYVELMVGAFSDNQPDYSWIKPYEVKTITQYWYPVRDIGGVKNANLNAAVNLDLISDNKARLGFHTTGRYSGARVMLSAGGRSLFEKTVDIAPDKPFVREVSLPAGTKETDLAASLQDCEGGSLISYSPVKRNYDPNLPPVVTPPPPPEDIKTVEELYLTGLRIQQMHNPTVEPYPYYEEALRRDPCNVRVNTILGIVYNKRALYGRAERKLRTAVGRLTHNYTRPRNCEAHYQLGLALRAQGKYDAAYDNFYRATWDYAFHTAGYYQLAEISCLGGDYSTALEQINRCLSTNALNTRALALKSAILRKLGRHGRARKTALKALEIDPLDFRSINELYLIDSAANSSGEDKWLDKLTSQPADRVQTFLEIAAGYQNAGLWEEAIDILSRLDVTKAENGGRYPMIYYYLGWLYHKKGNSEKSLNYYKLAAQMPPDYCFPFRSESISILNHAIRMNPTDARAYCYLGNLLYDDQPENAITAWEKSAHLDPNFAITHRTLGWAYHRTENDLQKAISAYERAVACDSENPRFFAELDILYERAGTSPAKRLALLEANQETVVSHDASFLRLIMTLVLAGRYDDAIEHLTSNTFHVWEGGGEIHDVYVDALLLRGMQRLEAGEGDSALADFKAADLYPENLAVGRPQNDRRAPQVAWCTALALEALGRREQAVEYWEKAASQQATSHWPQTRYYQALALRKLGREKEADEIFRRLIEIGKKRLTAETGLDFFAKFGEKQTQQHQQAEAHYILGLGFVGNGDVQKAKDHLGRAVKLNAGHLWAAVQLERL